MRTLVRRPLLVLFVFYLLLHVFIFWQALASWPDIIAGKKFIAKDELIPIFDWSSQFFHQIVGGGQSLTYSNEVRLSYTFWTAWTRHTAILPGALVLLNTVSATLFTYSIFHVLRSLLHPSRLKYTYLTLYAAFLGTFPLYLILLYSKLTTFYSLIIGFSMFALAISFILVDIFIVRRLTVKRALIVGALVLLNPAIHYHVLFYIVCAVVFIGALVSYFVKKTWTDFWPLIKYSVIVAVISGVPYALLILVSLKVAGAGDVTDQIPLSYWGIYYNSIPLEHQFGFSTTAQIDVGKYGSYLATIPRLTTMILFVLVIAGFIVLMRIKSFARMTKFYIACFAVMLVAMFMTIGYGENKSSYSFHVMLSQLTGIMDYAGQVGALFNKAVYTFMNILRYPHRFQFIQYYFAALVLAISILTISIYFKSRLKLVLPVLGIVVIGAIFANGDYRAAFANVRGEMGGFTRAYEVSDNLKEIRGYLQAADKPKLFILPSLESGRYLKQNNKAYSFIDKAWIYYLNTPTYYYGAGASMQNKAMANEVYTSLSAGTTTWEQVLSGSIGATHILVPKSTWVNLLQVQYQPHLERDVRRALAKATSYKPVITGSDYILLERSAPFTSDNCIVEEAAMTSGCSPGAHIYFPLQFAELRKASHGTSEVHTKDIERTKVSLEAAAHQKHVFYPSSDRLPYQENMVEGSVFATTGPSLQVLRMEKSRYNLFKRKLPPMSSLLAPKFVGTTKKGLKLDYAVSGMSSGVHEVYLFALSNRSEITIRVNGRDYEAKVLKGSTDKNAYRYYRVTLSDMSTHYKATVTQETDEPLVVSHLYVRDARVASTETYEQLSQRSYKFTF